MRPVRRLSAAQSWRVRCWVDGRRDEASRTPAGVLAQKAGADLGFVVTESHMSQARKDCGVVLVESLARQGGLRDDLAELARAVGRLYELAGIKWPAEVGRIAGGKAASVSASAGGEPVFLPREERSLPEGALAPAEKGEGV